MENLTGILADNLINVANVLYLLSYFVRDMLRLRVFTVIAAGFLIVFFYSQPEPIMAAIYWNLFFISLNVAWIVRLLRKRHHVKTQAICPS